MSRATVTFSMSNHCRSQERIHFCPFCAIAIIYMHHVIFCSHSKHYDLSHVIKLARVCKHVLIDFACGPQACCRHIVEFTTRSISSNEREAFGQSERGSYLVHRMKREKRSDLLIPQFPACFFFFSFLFFSFLLSLIHYLLLLLPLLLLLLVLLLL